MENIIKELIPGKVLTLGDYIIGRYGVPLGKTFGARRMNYVLNNVYCMIGTKEIIGSFTVIDLEMCGSASQREINLTRASRMRNLPELVEGFNAKRIFTGAHALISPSSCFERNSFF